MAYIAKNKLLTFNGASLGGQSNAGYRLKASVMSF
jgi:hypothetical protein